MLIKLKASVQRRQNKISALNGEARGSGIPFPVILGEGKI